MAITNGFEMVFNRRLIFGENKVTEIPGILNWYNKKKVLFVTFSAEFDAFKKISSLLTDAGMAVVPYEVLSQLFRLLTTDAIFTLQKDVTVPLL